VQSGRSLLLMQRLLCLHLKDRSNLQFYAANSSEMLVSQYQTKRYHVPEDSRSGSESGITEG
jgi:hypothetical protein